VLSVMGHSGMYDDSGKFSDMVGLPAKSGVSGNVMMVVPDKRLAVVVFSPRLDPAGNSVRGVEVCRRLVNEFGLHPYKGLGAERSRQREANRPAVAFRFAFDGTASGGTAGTASAGNDGARQGAVTVDRKPSQSQQL
jgi:glutaminase